MNMPAIQRARTGVGQTGRSHETIWNVGTAITKRADVEIHSFIFRSTFSFDLVQVIFRTHYVGVIIFNEKTIKITSNYEISHKNKSNAMWRQTYILFDDVFSQWGKNSTNTHLRTRRPVPAKYATYTNGWRLGHVWGRHRITPAVVECRCVRRDKR